MDEVSLMSRGARAARAGDEEGGVRVRQHLLQCNVPAIVRGAESGSEVGS